MTREDVTEDELRTAREVFGYWRTLHDMPLTFFSSAVTALAKLIDPYSTTVQRLKREEAVVKKLRRHRLSNLSTMQDLGGCRVIVHDLRMAYGVADVLGDISPKVREDDYIRRPQSSGYRSVHVVFRFEREEYIDPVVLEGFDLKATDFDPFEGLMIEVQVRTALQHAWATAVETVTFFSGEDIKSGEGPPDWQRLFALMGSVFAHDEGTAFVPGTPATIDEVYDEIRALVKKLDAIRVMDSYGLAIYAGTDELIERQINAAPDPKKLYVLFTLYPGQSKLDLSVIYADDEEALQWKYAAAEQEARGVGENVVVFLAKASSMRDLKKGYPNYFSDISVFMQRLERILALHEH